MLPALVSLDLSNNLVHTLQSIRNLSAAAPKLRDCNLRGNHVCFNKLYRRKTVTLFPALETLDLLKVLLCTCIRCILVFLESFERVGRMIRYLPQVNRSKKGVDIPRLPISNEFFIQNSNLIGQGMVSTKPD